MPRFPLHAAALIAAALPATAGAQDKDAEILARAFRVPPPNISFDGQIRRVTDATAMLKNVGVTFPPGANAILYEAVDILTVRNTQENINRVADFIASLQESRPETFLVTTHLIQGPGAILRPFASATDRPSQAKDLETLVAKASVEGSGIQLLHTQHSEMSTGYRCAIRSVAEHHYTGDLSVGPNGRLGVIEATRDLGLGIESTPFCALTIKPSTCSSARSLPVCGKDPARTPSSTPPPAGRLKCPRRSSKRPKPRPPSPS